VQDLDPVRQVHLHHRIVDLPQIAHDLRPARQIGLRFVSKHLHMHRSNGLRRNHPRRGLWRRNLDEHELFRRRRHLPVLGDANLVAADPPLRDAREVAETLPLRALVLLPERLRRHELIHETAGHVLAGAADGVGVRQHHVGIRERLEPQILIRRAR
jgi:hypothetical protein